MNKYSQFSKNKQQPENKFFIPQAKLDYHEIEITHHYQIEEELDHFLNSCKKNNKTKVLVITGKGMIIRPEIKKLLKKHKLIKSYKQAGYYNGQDGAFEIFIK